MKPAKVCRHCKVKNANRSRGLCWSCYYAPGVRDLYPSKSKHGPRPEPTQEEVDRMVADGYANLPSWWDEETRKEVSNTEEI